MSNSYQVLHGILRQHTSDLILRLSAAATTAIDEIRALLIIASYSNSGAILVDVALNAANTMGLQQNLEALLGARYPDMLPQDAQAAKGPVDRPTLTAGRVYYYMYVLDTILSLDGGKPASMILRSPPQRVRALIARSDRTPLDLRLFAQVELNTLRTNGQSSVASAEATSVIDRDGKIGQIVQSFVLDLDLWMIEWQDLVAKHCEDATQCSVLQLNIRVQHMWASMALHLRALAVSGIENIAVMTERQRRLAIAAKTAVEHHLQLQLSDVCSVGPAGHIGQERRPYMSSFRYAMEFVWAKNTFSILILLRLGLLLGDPPDNLLARLSEAKDFLNELSQIGMGANLGYLKIAAQTVRRCEKAIQIYLRLNDGHNIIEQSGDDFQSFIPEEFVFEWDFPGLHLCYVPMDWQDLFVDFETGG